MIQYGALFVYIRYMRIHYVYNIAISGEAVWCGFRIYPNKYKLRCKYVVASIVLMSRKIGAILVILTMDM
jgi:hypothetical protein